MCITHPDLGQLSEIGSVLADRHHTGFNKFKIALNNKLHTDTSCQCIESIANNKTDIKFHTFTTGIDCYSAMIVAINR